MDHHLSSDHQQHSQMFTHRSPCPLRSPAAFPKLFQITYDTTFIDALNAYALKYLRCSGCTLNVNGNSASYEEDSGNIAGNISAITYSFYNGP